MTSWRDCHNYSGDNHEQQCSKCFRLLLAKDQQFPPDRTWTDKEPVCPVREERTFSELIRTKNWVGKVPNSYFFIHPKPFTVQYVTLEDLMAEAGM